MPVTRSKSYLFDYESLLDNLADGVGVPTLSLEDRVPVGKYCVVGESTKSLPQLASLASSLNLAGYVFELGDAIDTPLRWSPSMDSQRGWQRNQFNLFVDKAPFFSSNGQFYGPQTLRSAGRIVVGAKFNLGRTAIEAPSQTAIEAARISNRLDLDFVVLDVSRDDWKVPRAGAILLTLVTQLLDHMRRPALAPLMPRISHFKPVFIALPPTITAGSHFLNEEGSVELFANGFTSGKVFPLPKVSASSPASVQDRWEWTRPPTQADTRLATQSELYVDARAGIGLTSSAVSNGVSESNVTIRGIERSVKSGFVLVDDIDRIASNGSFPGANPTEYWDYDDEPVDGSYVLSIFPHPIPPALVRQRFEYKLSPWGFPDEEGTPRDLFVLFENWKTGKTPNIVTIYDHACEGYQTLGGKWIRINGRYLGSLPSVIPMETNGFSISGEPILGDEGYYPFLLVVQSEFGNGKTETSFNIPVYNNLSEYTPTVSTPPLDYTADILVQHPPRYNPKRVPFEWSPIDDWCTQRRVFTKVPFAIKRDIRTIPSDTSVDPVVGEVYQRAPINAQSYISRHFPPSQWENAAIVGECESSWNPNANALTSAEDSRGWFQINIIEDGTLGDGWVEYKDEDLYDPETNTRIAAEIWRRAGWRPWSCASIHGLDLSVPSLDSNDEGVGVFGWTYPTDSVRVTDTCDGHMSRAVPFKAIDIGALTPGVGGDNIYAVADGVIGFYGWDPSHPEGSKSGYGIKVELAVTGNESITVRYGHLDPTSLTLLNFQQGDEVQKGDVIGFMGTTGNSTGYHLHIEVFEGTERVCPDLYLPLL